MLGICRCSSSARRCRSDAIGGRACCGFVILSRDNPGAIHRLWIRPGTISLCLVNRRDRSAVAGGVGEPLAELPRDHEPARWPSRCGGRDRIPAHE